MRRKLFKNNPELVKELVVLYEAGKTMEQIAIQYGCHHTTIMFWLHHAKAKIRPPHIFTKLDRPTPPPPRTPKPIHPHELTNPGKTYKQYLAIERNKALNRKLSTATWVGGGRILV